MNRRFLLVLAGTAVLGSGGSALAAVITFDDIPNTGNAIQTSVTSDGFDFTGDHFHILDSPGAFVRNASTSYLTAEAANALGRPVTMTKAGGGTFTLAAVDVAELWLPAAGLDDSFYVYITANRLGGGSLSSLITLDGIRDGTGGVADFQLVTFSGWTDLTDVTFTGRNAAGAFGDYSIDNVVVDSAPVPEPATCTLLAIGSAVLLRRRRRLH